MSVCKWCGQRAVSRDIEEGLEAYGCGSLIYDDGRSFQWTACKLNVAKQRIAAAIEATQQASRFDIIAERDGTIVAQPDSTGCYAWASVLDDIAKILRANSPENPEGSPNLENEQ